jgi:hypothetical protein
MAKDLPGPHRDELELTAERIAGDTMIVQEFKVNMKDARGRRSFTLVNARSASAARRIAAKNHPSKIIGVADPTGRTF